MFIATLGQTLKKSLKNKRNITDMLRRRENGIIQSFQLNIN